MITRDVQSTVNMYPKWTQTIDEMSTMRSDLYNKASIQTEDRSESSTLVKQSRDTSNNLRKKRSIISKASIKRPNQVENPPEDIIFSPGDKRTSSKLSSTMKKSNTFSSSTRVGNSLGNSNRFLFRGNEAFHNTVGRHGLNIRPNEPQPEQPLYVSSGNRQKAKKDIKKP